MLTPTQLSIALMGHMSMDVIEHNGQKYISVDDAMEIINEYKIKLINKGLFKLDGLEPKGVIELFTILVRYFGLIEKHTSINCGTKNSPDMPY